MTARKRVIAGAVVLLLVGGGAYLATQGDGIDIPGLGPADPPTPKFNFEVLNVAVRTTTASGPKQVEERANPVADEVVHALDILYSGAFVDPDVWEGDDYEDLFDSVMEEAAAVEAMGDVGSLTLGEGAGDIYDFVEPTVGRVKVVVLTGTDDEPVQAIATVAFSALAEHDDGTFTKIASDGTYFFKKIDGDWRIFSFDVARNEKAVDAPQSATPTATTAAETTP